MKSLKYISITGLALSLVALGSCNEDKFTYDEYWLDGEEEVIEDPENPGGEQVVEPTYSFETMTKNVKVDPSITYQTCEGIGASDCWLPNVLGEYWTTNRSQLSKWLFSQKINNGVPEGIGLSMWRVNLGAGTEELGAAGGIDEDNKNNRAPSYAKTGCTAANFEYDWNKCAGQRYFMEQAKNEGVESFVLFSNSPLTQFTKNGKGMSNAGSNANLKDDYYDDYAVYMAEVAKHFEDLGYNVSHISPVNEPQYNWNGSNQEGSGWKNTQVAKLARELQKALDDKGVKTKISLGEAGAWDCLYQGDDARQNTLARFLTDGSDAYVGDLSRLDNICAHSYYTDGQWGSMRDVRQKAADAAAIHGIKLWQTEWSMLVNGPNHYGNHLDDSTTPWDIAQWMAAVIHNDFCVAGVTSWSYWTSMSVERWSQMDRFMLINCVPTGGNYSNDFTQEGHVEAFPTLWVLGNYSLFVRPGYKRIDLNMIESENFFGDAWISPDGKQVVCVFTNRMAERGVKVKIPTGGWGSEVASIMRYTTTRDKNLEGQEWNKNYTVVCEPSSVTTVVYNLQ